MLIWTHSSQRTMKVQLLSTIVLSSGVCVVGPVSSEHKFRTMQEIILRLPRSYRTEKPNKPLQPTGVVRRRIRAAGPKLDPLPAFSPSSPCRHICRSAMVSYAGLSAASSIPI